MNRNASLLPTLLLVMGCSRGPTPIRVPNVNPAVAAKSALEMYDTNLDGQLSDDEIQSCPGIVDGITYYDRNEDGRVSADEIAERLAALYGDGVGILAIGCRVLSGGRPVAEARVELIPESFLGDAVEPAGGTTRANGVAMLRIDPNDLPAGLENVRGVQSGVYRARVTHPTLKIPARFNSESEVGFDVSMDDQVGGLTIELRH